LTPRACRWTHALAAFLQHLRKAFTARLYFEALPAGSTPDDDEDDAGSPGEGGDDEGGGNAEEDEADPNGDMAEDAAAPAVEATQAPAGAPPMHGHF
jgi:hypothetical protein